MRKFKKAPNNPEEFDYKKLLFQTLFATLAIVILFVILGLIFKKPLYNYSKIFVEQYGIFAVFGGFLMTAISPIPLPDHALSAFAWIGGMSFWINVVVSTIGSLVGGICAYCLGKLLKNMTLYVRLMKQYKVKSENLIKSHGVKGLAIACLTPIPDSPVMWMSGTLDLPFYSFFWTLLVCRFIKITYILWFIKLGLMSI